MAELDEDDPRRNMPIMYQRQQELSDGRLVFHGGRPPKSGPSVALAQLKTKMKKRKRFGTVLMVANLVVLVAMFFFFKAGDSSVVRSGGLELSLRAVIYSDSILGTCRVTMDGKTGGLPGAMVKVWIWPAPEKVGLKADTVTPPADALFFVDVLPKPPELDRVYRERFPWHDGASPEGQRLHALVECNGARLLAVSRINPE